MDSKSILVHEACPIILWHLETFLSDHNWKVITTHCVEEVEELCRNQSPDLVVLHLRCHTQTADIQLAQRLKRRFNIPVYFITAYLVEEIRLEQDFPIEFEVISKPFTHVQLRRFFQNHYEL